MTDQTPDLAALAALAEAASAPPWVAEYSLPTGDCVIQEDAQSTMEAIALCTGYRSGLDAAFIAAAHPGTVLWLIREVKRLREPLDDLEIINGLLVQRGVHEPEYPAGVEYGPMPCSDAEPLVQLSTLSGWPDITRAEKAEATIERARELADSWAGSRSDLGPVTRACGALLRAALDGGEPDA